MNHIFISYSSKDVTKTKAFAKMFEKQSWKVWWDKNIEPGKAFDRSIGKALDDANCIVVLWSPNSVESSWVLDEAYEGLERNILVPVLIEETRIPFGYRRLQYVDMTKWDGKSKTPNLKEVLESVALLNKINTPKFKPGEIVEAKKKAVKKVKRKRSLSGALDGKRIVFTGSLSESRTAHEEKVRAVGARFVDTVSGKTNYLVVGKEPGQVKLKAAEKAGIKKLTEKQWLKLLNQTYRRTLENKQIVFTGKLAVPRHQLEEIAKALGAVPTSKISAKTDFLIVGEKPGKVKLNDAEKYGVKIFNEAIWNDIAATL